MSKVRIVYRPDNTITVIHPAPKSQRPGETEQAWLDRVFAKAMQSDLKGLPYDDVDKSQLPASRDYRNAWEGIKGQPITINQTKKEAIDRAKKIDAEKIKLVEDQATQNLIGRGEIT